jgi:hypothetical protein
MINASIPLPPENGLWLSNPNPYMKKVLHIILSLFLVFIFAFDVQYEYLGDTCLSLGLSESDQAEADDDRADIQSLYVQKVDGGNGDDDHSVVQYSPISQGVLPCSVAASFLWHTHFVALSPLTGASSKFPTTFIRPGFFILYHSFKADIA